MRIRVNAAALGAYGFGLALVWLAGLTLAGGHFYLLLLCVFFPAASFVLLVRGIIAFHYFESFSTEHPVKHEEVLYTLTLANDTRLVPASVRVSFRSFGPDESLKLPPLDLVMRRRESRKEVYRLSFPFRGIYEVGMERLELSDGLGWLSWRPPVWCRTFYVYPRVVELDRVFPALSNVVESSGSGRGVIADHALFRELREYRGDGPVRHIAWKKFAASGVPCLREYEKTSWPGVEIYLDLRRPEQESRAVLEREDCSVEILVALVRYFLRRNVGVRIHGVNGHERYAFSGNEEDDFARFFKATIAITFSGDRSPARLFRTDREDRLVAAGTVLFITHSSDPEILELAAGGARQELSFFAVLNRSGVPSALVDAERDRIPARSRGNVAFVEAIDSIRESLEQ